MGNRMTKAANRCRIPLQPVKTGTIHFLHSQTTGYAGFVRLRHLRIVVTPMIETFDLRQYPDPSPPPVKEPPDGPENPDVPVQEPDPTQPSQI